MLIDPGDQDAARRASTRLLMRDTQGQGPGAVADVRGPGPGEEPKDGRIVSGPLSSPEAHGSIR